MTKRLVLCSLLLAAPFATRGAGGADAASRPAGLPGDRLPDPLAAGWRGAPVCERLHEEATLRVLRCTFPPGAGHERHFHPPHFGYALSGGRMRLTDARGAREVEIETGSSFTSDGVAWHEVLNVGETTVSYLIVEPRGAADMEDSDLAE
jgi:quercetin dioxygenase-like cupin family protein